MNANRRAVTVRLDPELHALLTRVADERDVSVNFVVARALRAYLPYDDTAAGATAVALRERPS